MFFTAPLNPFSKAFALFKDAPCDDSSHFVLSAGNSMSTTCTLPKTLIVKDDGAYALVHTKPELDKDYVLNRATGTTLALVARMTEKEARKKELGKLRGEEAGREETRTTIWGMGDKFPPSTNPSTKTDSNPTTAAKTSTSTTAKQVTALPPLVASSILAHTAAQKACDTRAETAAEKAAEGTKKVEEAKADGWELVEGDEEGEGEDEEYMLLTHPKDRIKYVSAGLTQAG